MQNFLYNGSSDGFRAVTDGYIDYAKEVIVGRAFPDLRDGLKLVGRRILYSAHSNLPKNVKNRHLEKCIPVVSDALKLHPHGDSSVYGALCLMTDENGSNNVPFFKGQGNLGKVYSSDSPAAMRYPKVMLNENADILFRDSEVMDLIPSEEGVGVEPKVIPAPYPVILVNGSQGIAVSVSAEIPSFNFGEVLDLTIKYLQNGSLEVTDIIAPDFPVGGILVQNDEELAKIMKTGHGKLKVRARVEISGKDILVKEVPYGKVAEGIIKQINKAEIKEISKVMNTMGKNSPALVTISCKTKKSVEYVLMELYRRNILQNQFSSNILVLEDDVPLIIGVHEIIERWCAWRRRVLEKKFNLAIDGLKEEMTQLGYFIRLISNPEWRDTYVDKAVHVDKASASSYLHEIFDDIPEWVCDWIHARRISAFNNGGKYVNRYSDLQELKKSYEENLADLNTYIINELKDLKVEKAGTYDRRTELTYQDYKFSKITESTIVDTSFCVYTLFKNGFIKKTREEITGDDVLCSIKAQANSILVGFDNYGRVLRIPGVDIEFTSSGSNGLYLPNYFEGDFQEDYRILYMCNLDGSRKMLVYKDGYVGFFDTSEWVGKKVVKVVGRGVDTSVYDLLVDVVEEDDLKDYLVVADQRNGKIRFGIARVDTIPVRSRVSRAKVFYGDDANIKYLHCFNQMDTFKYIENPERYIGKLRNLKGEIYGDASLMEDGRYTE